MRLTAEVVDQYGDVLFTPALERELRLRQLQVAVIENLGCTKNLFDSIDLSDNEIVLVAGASFPKLSRLRTLILNNNRIAKIGDGLKQQLPALENLILTRNNLASFEDIQCLGELNANLLRISLMGNPVSRLPGYREFMIEMLPNLRSLDFTKITQKERSAALKKIAKKQKKRKKGADYSDDEEMKDEQPHKKKPTFTEQQKQFLFVSFHLGGTCLTLCVERNSKQ
jgi:U2 small nuclear ribonucleoprotein A'